MITDTISNKVVVDMAVRRSPKSLAATTCRTIGYLTAGTSFANLLSIFPLLSVSAGRLLLMTLRSQFLSYW
jgi:hypothetical protein